STIRVPKGLPTIMKYVLVLLLLLIVASLFSGLYFMYRDKGETKRTVHALTLRVALSLVTFAIVMLGYWLGWFPGR
ncbi:MAG TPA: twin transmembrane helix small protein, partial [Usitatibacteraceae bacterium]|nr:twin transmembrane helix small protein [Usitatibacteraceae bacterium]